MNKNIDFKTTYLSEVDSTNTYLKTLALQGASEGTVVVADRQTGGRGRLGRSFFSPSDTGLYMSLLLKPSIPASEAVKITAFISVAVSRAIDKLSGKKSQIKWVNDIYIDGCKVCGILTEATFSGSGSLDYVIVGIGINVFPPKSGFPEDIVNKAGWVFDFSEPSKKEQLLAQILEEINNLDDFTKEYKERSCVIGKNVTVLQSGISYPAKVLDITDSCSLKISLTDRSVKYLSSGEISLQGDFS